MTARAFELATAPTYALYTDHVDAVKAKVYVEMGQVFAVPRVDEHVLIGEQMYIVDRVLWTVYDEAEPGEMPGHIYPQQHATILLRKVAR